VSLKTVSDCPHTAAKHYSRGKCRNCYEKWLRTANPAFAERQRRKVRKWTNANRERKRSYDRSKHRYHLLRKYGLTQDDYDRMLKQQNGCCSICQRPATSSRHGRLHVDHCHASGQVRGLLCHHCNYGIGVFKDNPKWMRRAAAYVENQTCQSSMPSKTQASEKASQPEPSATRGRAKAGTTSCIPSPCPAWLSTTPMVRRSTGTRTT
jgi:hypothetical protein